MKTNPDKSLVLELKGDKLVAAQKNKKAFAIYQEALELNPERVELYDKLIALHNQYAENWDENDFATNLTLTMKKQELLDPTFKRVHARHHAAYKTAADTIKKMLAAQTTADETSCVEQLMAQGSAAIYPLIDSLLTFKQILQRKKPEQPSHEQNAKT